jgi:hypothetical protein
MIGVLLLGAILVCCPKVRHAAGELVWWSLALVSLTLLLGEAGALIAFAVGLCAFVFGLARR